MGLDSMNSCLGLNRYYSDNENLQILKQLRWDRLLPACFVYSFDDEVICHEPVCFLLNRLVALSLLLTELLAFLLRYQERLKSSRIKRKFRHR